MARVVSGVLFVAVFIALERVVVVAAGEVAIVGVIVGVVVAGVATVAMAVVLVWAGVLFYGRGSNREPSSSLYSPL